MEEKLMRLLSLTMNVFLSILAMLIVIYMGFDLVNIFKLIFIHGDVGAIDSIADYILGFFMLFEFIIMTLQYVDDAHNIPIKYLVLISITAILRQLLVVHNNGGQTLLLTIAILILTLTLYLLELIKAKEKIRKNK
ncbi:phosphate-starvation-inducible PsiE family protein [Vagococcus luciliae]|uniref:Protein PsiE n=1 Tax=Vagococcus luciliae TaxID=2920380 RepID=A0ABY5P089_9ENTE|nr:phosphate-starvation-inducible PsiE family protein [Vagococcus luciliae]UUV99332.1 Protein PsiE [Vagococcus luciliae]